MKCSLLGATLIAAIATTAEARQVDERLLSCVAHVVYGEARGSRDLEEKYSIAWSVIFRAQANQAYFGGSDLCNVAYKTRVLANGTVRWEYDGANVAVTDMRAWDESVEVAYYVLMGEGRPNRPVMYFCAPYACGGWHDVSSNLAYVGSKGGHKFYIDRRFYQPGSSDVVEVSASWE